MCSRLLFSGPHNLPGLSEAFKVEVIVFRLSHGVIWVLVRVGSQKVPTETEIRGRVCVCRLLLI